MKKINFNIITPLSLILLLQGCMPDSLTKFKKDSPTKAPSNIVTPTVPTAPPDLTTLKVFELKNITQKNTSYNLHKYGQGNASVKCEIPSNKIQDGQNLLIDGESDVLCWLEADEVQLYYSGVDLQVNAPIGQCEFVRITPYYYWNAQPINSQKIVKNVTCDNPGSAKCLNYGGVTVANKACLSDYTSIGGPNCDEGKVTVNSYNIAADNTVTTSTVTNDCGGKRTRCYGGPGVDFQVDGSGFPVPVSTVAYSGQSINYSVLPPGSPMTNSTTGDAPVAGKGKGYHSNYYAANFTSLFSTGTNTYDYTTIGSLTGLERYANYNASSNLTYADLQDATFDDQVGKSALSIAGTDAAMDPLKRADYASPKTGGRKSYPIQIFYEFSCMNYAQETKARIRLQVREWNQDFLTPLSFMDPGADTDVTKSAPLSLLRQSQNSTDFENSGVGFWNDVPNWDTPFSYGSSAGFVPPTATDSSYGFLFPYEGFTPTK